MSIWYEVEDDEISIDYQHREVDFLVCSDYQDQGSVYLSLSFQQLKEIAAKIEKITRVDI